MSVPSEIQGKSKRQSLATSSSPHYAARERVVKVFFHVLTRRVKMTLLCGRAGERVGGLPATRLAPYFQPFLPAKTEQKGEEGEEEKRGGRGKAEKQPLLAGFRAESGYRGLFQAS